MSDISDDDISGDIARIEAEIERLAESLERCRKIALAAKTIMVLGAAGLVALLTGMISFDLTGLMAAITALLGGFVAYGSNGSTEQQTMQALRDAEAERADMIGGIDLRLVEDAGGGFPRRRLGRGPVAPY